jgi:hypothetical protein
VPVRLLPIASKSTVTAERWARILAQADPDMLLTAYHFVDGLMMELPPKYWRDRSSEDQLPPGAFVWRDHLEAAYSRVFYSDALKDNAPDGPEYMEIIPVGKDDAGEPRFVLELNNDLLLDAPLDSEEQHRWVFEGLEALKAHASAPAQNTSMLTEQGIWEIHFNNSSVIDWNGIAVPTGRRMLRAKAILWMHGLKPRQHPLLTDSLDDEEVPNVIPRRVRDVVGVEDFFRQVRDALDTAAAENMEEATAAAWVTWADEREMPVHSKFRAIAECQIAPVMTRVGTPRTETEAADKDEEKPPLLAGHKAGAERKKPKAGDALTRLIWEICYDLLNASERPTPMPVMQLMKIRAQSPDPAIRGPLMSSTAGGVKWEDADGNERELSSSLLKARIREWKKAKR